MGLIVQGFGCLYCWETVLLRFSIGLKRIDSNSVFLSELCKLMDLFLVSEFVKMSKFRFVQDSDFFWIC